MKKNDRRVEYNCTLYTEWWDKKRECHYHGNETFKLWLDPDEIKDWEKHGWKCIQNSGQINMF